MLPPAARSAISSHLAVGFADLCGYTALVRSLDDAALADLLDRFELAATLVLPTNGATVVKLLGDGVLFHAPDAATAVDAALALIDEARRDPRLPGVRAAIASGRVLLRGGDCFGDVVNRASRLLDAAPTHGVAVDASARDETRHWRPLGARALRDYGPWQVWTASTTGPTAGAGGGLPRDVPATKPGEVIADDDGPRGTQDSGGGDLAEAGDT